MSARRYLEKGRLWSPRWLAWLLALVNGYFWIPCPTCGRSFAGFESGGPAIEKGMQDGGAWFIECVACSNAREGAR